MCPWRCRLHVVAVFVTLVATAAGAQTVDPRAREHLTRGLRLYDAQKYADAIAEFQAGYQIDPQPDFLYAMGQAERLNGDCRRAIAAFEAYLRTSPSPKQGASAKEKLAWCHDELRRHPEAAPPAPAPTTTPPAQTTALPAPAPPATVVAPAPPRPTPPPRRRPWAWSLGATALALAAGGTIAAVHASSDYDTYRHAPLDHSFSDISTQATIANVFFATAGAAAIASVFLFVFAK
jgi:tetratricopeptide (TPR) repeat protein